MAEYGLRLSGDRTFLTSAFRVGAGIRLELPHWAVDVPKRTPATQREVDNQLNFERVNQWLALLANLGVLVGIAFLVLELRQNTDMMRAQSRADMSRDVGNLLSMHVNDPAYIDAMGRGLRGEELTEIEASQFSRTYNAMIWHWNNLEYQHRAGLYPTTEYRLQMNIIRSDLSRLEGFREHWCAEKAANASIELIESVEAGPDGVSCE